VGGAVDAVKSAFGGQSKELREQARAIAEREREVAAAAEGQRKARSSDRGLLVFAEDYLKKTFGGG
jgi:hypothetical protein